VRKSVLGAEYLACGHDASTTRFDAQLVGVGFETLQSIVEQAESRRPMLVLDRAAAQASGLANLIDSSPLWAGRVFDGVEPNPTIELAQEALDASASWNPDGVVAIGGGSCIDLAKAVAVGLAHAGETEAVLHGDTAVQAAVPIVAVPTSAGSGSQATSFGVLYVAGRKRSLDHPTLRPAAVVLDARFVSAMPARAAAISGLDALCQCVESMWACRATEESRKFAAQGGRLMFENLVKAVRDREPEALQAITLGAHLSGCAINISRTTAAHAYSYALTQHHGIPHGLAVAHALGWVARWNAGVDPDTCAHPNGFEAAGRFIEQAAGIMGCNAHGVTAQMQRLCDELGLPPSMHSAGVRRTDLAALAQAVDPQRLSNNPRVLSQRDILACTESQCCTDASGSSLR